MDTRRETQADDLWPLLEASYDGVLLVEANSWRVIRVNGTAARWLGQSAEELIGRSASELFLEESREAILRQFETELLTASSEGPTLAKLKPLERRKRVVAVKSCQIAWKGELALGVWLLAVQQSGRFWDMPDPLARWRDRVVLERRLSELMHAYEIPKPFALMFIDLDNFKAVNDRHGHTWGDRVLRTVAMRLAECLGEGDLAARYGGDEFLVLVQTPKDAATVEQLADRIRDTVSKPMVVPGETFTLAASIGIAWASPEYRTPEDAIAAADRAMYAMKRAK